MAIHRDQTFAVIEKDRVSVKEIVACGDDHAVCGRLDGSAGRTRNVHARMWAAGLVVEYPPQPVGAGADPRNRLEQPQRRGRVRGIRRHGPQDLRTLLIHTLEVLPGDVDLGWGHLQRLSHILLVLHFERNFGLGCGAGAHMNDRAAHRSRKRNSDHGDPAILGPQHHRPLAVERHDGDLIRIGVDRKDQHSAWHETRLWQCQRRRQGRMNGRKQQRGSKHPSRCLRGHRQVARVIIRT